MTAEDYGYPGDLHITLDLTDGGPWAAMSAAAEGLLGLSIQPAPQPRHALDHTETMLRDCEDMWDGITPPAPRRADHV